MKTAVPRPPRPDYGRLRERAGFHWSVGSTVYALLELTGVPLGAYNLDPEVGVQVYREGRPLFRELFPDPAIPLPAVHTPAVSYGHVNCLGAELVFPDAGEVGVTHPCDSIDGALALLRQSCDFARCGMAPFYLEYRRRLQEAFPDEPVGFAFGLEGPVTTAWELCGEPFFIEVMDSPGRACELLEAVCRSVQDYWGFYAEVNGVPALNPNGAGLCDDLASMVPPRLFPELVLPSWDRFFRGRTTGVRSAHVEDLRPAQLPFLEAIGLSYFDPSISPKLSPPLIRDGCRVPFGWRLGSFHYLTMTERDVRDWVFQAAADGASRVFTYIEGILCREPQAGKVRVFIEAAREAERMLREGADRADLARCVSPEGKERFWAHWPEP